MKNLLLLLLTLLFLDVAAQSPKKIMSNQQKSEYQSRLEKFYGTWVYEQEGKIFTIVLTHKQNVALNVPFLVGFHLYKDGSSMIDGNENQNSIASGTLDLNVVGGTRITFRFREVNNAIYAKGSLEFKGSSRDLLVWSLVLTEGQMINFDGKKPDYKLHVPNNIVLKRVK